MATNQLISLSDNLVQSRMAAAIEAQPIRREVSLQQIKIIDNEAIEYNGHPVKMSHEAFKDFMSILKVPTAFVDRFKNIVGPEAQQKFINTIKNVMASSDNKTVTLVLNPNKMEIVAVHKTSRNLVSNTTAIDFITNIIHESGLSVADFNINTDNGGIAVNTFSTNMQFNVPGMKDEHFIGGISFTNNPKNGFQVSPYINRLVCANGMVTRGFEEQLKLTNLSEKEMGKFMEHLKGLRDNRYQPAGFIDAVNLMSNTNASLAEMYMVENAIRNVSDIKRDELEPWVQVKSTEAAFARIGIDTNTLDNSKLKNAKTGTTVWDLINGLTHFATHDNGYEISNYDRTRLQVVAGQLLTKDPDMGNLVRSPF
jgi:hypothetical protein